MGNLAERTVSVLFRYEPGLSRNILATCVITKNINIMISENIRNYQKISENEIQSNLAQTEFQNIKKERLKCKTGPTLKDPFSAVSTKYPSGVIINRSDDLLTARRELAVRTFLNSSPNTHSVPQTSSQYDNEKNADGVDPR